ncbi:uncharacterized protein LOC136075335 [Hydra vulgaris]|uniref:Uncharacterized protein LOC136075335 n=1 Tax=Hydra vulgaris TaxID=6087 RepID=A0ABM4B5U0_HYDVU
MIEDMDAIKNPTIRERIEQGIMKAIISFEAKFGLGIETKTTQKNYQRSVKKAADLVDMQSFSKFNDGIKYLLMLIDAFSKYGWIVPLKSKTGVDVANALIKIFKERKCQKMWVGKGLEFYNKHVKALGVELYSTENEEKICVVERWNRKIEASDKKNENIAWLNLIVNAQSESVKPKFSIGDRVRITKKKGTFEKGYTPRRTEEVLTVSQTLFSDPPTYKITDDNGEEFQGTFYEQEMQKTDQNIFRIKKVIRKLKNKSLVKWYGYPESFNSWVDNKELISLKNL